MKVYMIFKRNKGFEPTLYAYTDDKKLMKKFMSIRRDDMFFVKKEEMDEDEFKEYRKSNYGNKIGLASFTTVDHCKDNPDIISHKVVLIPCTQEEYDYTDDPDMVIPIYQDDYWQTFAQEFIMTYAFKSGIRDALELLEYSGLGKLYIGIVLKNGDDDYSAPDLLNDGLGVFIYLFKNTLKV